MAIITVHSECCLTKGDDKLLNELKNRLTIDNPKYSAAVRYGRWVGKKIPEKLHFYRQEKDAFFMPRGFSRTAIALCQRYTGEMPTINDLRRSLPNQEFNFRGELRPYQEEAVQAVLEREFGVLEAGTGSGKTIMALAVIAARKQPALIIVHTKELLFQWAERIESFFGVTPGLIGDGHFSLAPVTVAIVNSARRKMAEITPHFGFVLVDECHRVPATLFTDVVNLFDGKYSLGLSATAYRRENALTRLIYFYMGELAHRVNAGRLQENGAILRPEIVSRKTGFTFNYRDNYAAMMTALTLDDPRNRQIADDVKSVKEKGNGMILVVSDRVSHCERLRKLLEERGCTTALLTGRVPAPKRLEIVSAIKEGTIDTLVATIQLIGEGFDAPGLANLFLATPVKFSGRLQQVIGRILRPEEGKQAIVYDYVDEKVGVLRSSAKARQTTYLGYL